MTNLAEQFKTNFMNNVITLQQAIDMTTAFRNNAGGLAPKLPIPRCETFDRAAIDQILSQAGCVKIRIYAGLNKSLEYRSIVVGVNDKDEDMLPAATDTSGDGNIISEDGITCPPFCPPPSSLNP